ncbi:alpha-amylase I-like [Anopheles ziemanni]|uniref:alpha-amylase I-like n=1 Tax=Anopheles coustani TaxID=139045 RepID=UPI0026591404|nr:alpha-amylase I-like [Anopheles coustani]XP_058178676.1 alpha-amylase I-like [Anopheles ziemanni]
MAHGWILLFLIAARYNIESIIGLQIGPFTVPSVGNGGAVGYSNSPFNASLNPSARSASFQAQIHQSGVGNSGVLPSGSLLTNVADERIEQLSKTLGTVTNPQYWSNISSIAASNISSDRANQLSRGNDNLSILPNVSAEASGRNVSGNRKDPHYYPGRTVMVHLFEWTFADIAEECERVLGPAGYGGVQVSPVNEYVVAPNRPWWERYQPISYEIRSRSGNEDQFAAMVRRCQRAGVRIYVDVVVNHMAAVGLRVPLYGTAGSPSDPENRLYPGVPYNRTHFHPECTITNYQYAEEVRNCALDGLPDLNQTESYVQDRIVDFMNRLIKLGVAGFRMDGSKHMWPTDLEVIYKRLHPLNSLFEFPPFSTPFIYQEVIDLGQEPITASQYTYLGEVTEFKYSMYIGLILRGTLDATALRALVAENSTQYGLIPSDSALVFVDNHDNQRGHGAGGASILTFKDGPKYIQAVAFTLATDYSTARIMSSYNFTDSGQGPPADGLEQIVSPGFNSTDGSCSNGWICEHRWPVFRRMVGFRNFAAVAPLTDVQTTSGTFAFCRGNIGFAVFNTGTVTRDGVFQTCLPPGEYCDLISGEKQASECTGMRVLVTGDGTVGLTLPVNSSVVLDLRNRVV